MAGRIPDHSREDPGELPRRIATRHLPNALRLHPRVISGGQPQGEAGFRELRDLGVKTIISVDGAQPAVTLARKYKLRYVHLPHGYDGIPQQRAVELAKAIRTLEGPIYIHCHHGKHRSPAAAAAACVAAGWLDKDHANGVLALAGTSPDYRGLFQAVARAQRLDDALLDQLPVEFPERAALPPLAEAMVALEQTHDRLKRVAQARWQAPPGHPDVDPAHEALMLREHFTEMLRHEETAAQPQDFVDLLRDSQKTGTELESLLRADAAEPAALAAADSLFERVTRNCAACHKRHRDIPLDEKPAP